MAEWTSTFFPSPGLPGAYCDLVRSNHAHVLLEFTTSSAGLLSATMFLAYMAFLRLSSRMSTPGFSRLQAKPPGAGKEGIYSAKAKASSQNGTSRSDHGDAAVTWLGPRELRVLEAFCDTFLPGFEIETTTASSAAVEQTLAMVRSNLFPGKSTTNGRAGAQGAVGKKKAGNPTGSIAHPVNRAAASLPPRVEAYTRALALRCLKMQSRPGSDIGVALLLARAFQTNIPEEQRSGLRILFRVLSTRVGALALTGRAVPFHSQSLPARHALLKRWSISRIGKFREAFQGMKRLTCSLYFSAHPEVPRCKDGSATVGAAAAGASAAAAAAAKIKTNPNWEDIRYDPQHHRFARDGNPNASWGGGQYTAAGAAKPGLWSGAKVKVSQTARAAAAAAVAATSGAPSPSRLPSANTNPPSPASSIPLSFSATGPAAATNAIATSKFFTRPRSKSIGSSNAAAAAAAAALSASSSCSSTWDDAAPEALPKELGVDVVVVGSGAGGGCAAGALAARGLKVAVLEKGGLYGASDFAGFSEMEAYKEMYEGQGVLATDDGAVVILAGSCVGGGTTINWAASFRTPRHVRLEWARKLGLKSFELGGPYDKALDAVCERMGVNTEHSHRAPGCPAPHASLRVNQHQSSLWNGAAASGRVPRAVPRNAEGCDDCGSCLHGCASGSKRSTHTTWLQDGLDSGNIILVPHAKVERVVVEAGRATGVEATVTPREGAKPTPLTVRARAVVVSGGAINTPAILLRSGLKHPMIGRHLCLHPVLVVGGVFPEDYDGALENPQQGGNSDESRRAASGSSTEPRPPVVQARAKGASNGKGKQKVDGGGGGGGAGPPGLCPRVPGVGRGVMMGVYVQDLMRLDQGYGCVIEAPPAHPGLIGLVLPWNDALTHRLLVGMSRETSVFLCIGRDRSSNDNRVVLGPRGDPLIKYKLGEEDSGVILQGRSEMLRMMRKAGASMLVPAHEGAPWFCPTDGDEGDEEFEEYIETIESLGTSSNEAGLFSAHQMGSCRLGSTPEDGPLRESGEAWECDGLFVADASVLPTSVGINPMITVEAVAYMVADQVATRLGKKTEALTRSESSPLRQKFKTLGKAVVAAISRDTSSTSDSDGRHALSRCTSGEGVVGCGCGDDIVGCSGETAPWGTLTQLSGGGRARGESVAPDDFGVKLNDLSWLSDLSW